jgi:hypothetical protein
MLQGSLRGLPSIMGVIPVNSHLMVALSKPRGTPTGAQLGGEFFHQRGVLRAAGDILQFHRVVEVTENLQRASPGLEAEFLDRFQGVVPV